MFQLSVQITAGRHTNKSNCCIGHASDGVTSSNILCMVGDRASKSSNPVF
jgi:hypothetical protein